MICIQVEEDTLGSEGLRKLPALVNTDGWAKLRGFREFFMDLLALSFKEYYSDQKEYNKVLQWVARGSYFPVSLAVFDEAKAKQERGSFGMIHQFINFP